MSIEDDIRTAVTPPRENVGPGVSFEGLRASVRGTIIHAHRELTHNGVWDTTDDRILDIVTAWLDQCKNRGAA